MSVIDYRDGPLFQHLILQQWLPDDGTTPAPCWQLQDGAITELPSSPALPMCSEKCPLFIPKEIELSRLALEGKKRAAFLVWNYCTHPVHETSCCEPQRTICLPAYEALWRRASDAEVTNG